MQFYTFKPITDFYYSIGKARTDVPWFRPDPEYLNRWKEEFFKIDGGVVEVSQNKVVVLAS